MTKKILKGVITSAKNDKTVVVEVVRKFKHPFYEKVIKRSKKYHAHDEKNKFKEGETVSIEECKPFSKTYVIENDSIQTELMVAYIGAKKEREKVLGLKGDTLLLVT